MSQKLLLNSLLICAAAALTSCSTQTSGFISLENWEKEAQLVAGSTLTPDHQLPQTEYPFDAEGNYIAAWAASGESRFGKASSTWASIIVIDKNQAMTAAEITATPLHCRK